MKRIPPPNISFSDVINACADGMLQPRVKQNYLSNFPILLDKEINYKQLCSSGRLYTYQRVIDATGETIILGNLKKIKLVNLYEGNLRNKEKKARKIYDKLMISSGEKCPFCGDIGQTKNLDHFLPISKFPEFSVMPLNLVPSCRDCNMGEKGDGFAITEEEQSIHPYLDKDIFFLHQWVYAEYSNEDTGAITYYVDCPEEWRKEDKDRAHNHFNNFNIAHRYSIEAGKHLSEIIDQKKGFIRMIRDIKPDISSEKIKKAFITANIQPIIESDKFNNDWKKVMYKCLKNSDSFFNDV